MQDKIYPPYKKLIVPTNWAIRRVAFYDVSPETKDIFRDKDNEIVSNFFKSDLILLHYAPNSVFLDMGWVPKTLASGEYNLPDGQYIAQLVKEAGWEEISTLRKTLSIKEITDAINNSMLDISLKNGDYRNYPQGLNLQEFVPSDHAKYTKHEFFDIEPHQDLSLEQWKLFQEEMLVIEHYSSDDWKIKAGWFPEFNPQGNYRIEVISGYWNSNRAWVYETKEKTAAVEYIDDILRNNVWSNLRKMASKMF